jgi:hypothetical protein
MRRLGMIAALGAPLGMSGGIAVTTGLESACQQCMTPVWVSDAAR